MPYSEYRIKPLPESVLDEVFVPYDVTTVRRLLNTWGSIDKLIIRAIMNLIREVTRLSLLARTQIDTILPVVSHQILIR